MTIIVQSMGIPSVELHFRRRIYPEVHLLAKLFQNIESNGSASLSQSWRVQGAVAITVWDFEQNKKPPRGDPYGRGYAANGPYAPGYAGSPGYAYPGSVTVEIGDRPYYTHGPGYYVGRTYYVWRPGHWANRHGQRVWIRGHYVVRG
jgi:hypothetical protein